MLLRFKSIAARFNPFIFRRSGLVGSIHCFGFVLPISLCLSVCFVLFCFVSFVCCLLVCLFVCLFVRLFV